jgi:pSer/pThr/pTyr-binding forkhead associated (FHA) protein
VLNKTYQLIVRKGSNEGEEFPLTSVITTIGRDPMADITINDPELSRLHARLVETAVGYELEDLGSTNGTYLEGQLIAGGPAPLTPGQEIQMGSDLVLLFQAIETIAAPPASVIEPEVEEGERTVIEMVEAEETAVAPIESTAEIEASEEANGPAETAPEDWDPMLPPTFEDLPAYPDLPEIPLPDKTDFDLAALPDFPELDEQPLVRRTPPPARKAAPRVVPSEPAAPPAKSGGISTKQIVGILVGVLALTICCCCGFLLFLYQWGGDWLLRQGGMIP